MRKSWTVRHMVTRVVAWPLIAASLVVAYVGLTSPGMLQADYDDNGRRIVNVG